ncbi:MAG: TolC family protein [Ginsengibacter sp.]
MKIIFLVCGLFLGGQIFAQRIQQVPDSLRKQPVVQPIDEDAAIKARLVKLAQKNPTFIADDAAIEIAELNRKKATSSWLSSVTIGGNLNEFSINNSPAGNFYPKYNFGVQIPLDIYARNKNERLVGDQNIIIANAAKADRMNRVKAETLIRYENFKEQRELANLQKISVDNNYSDYLAGQSNFADNTITVDVLNKIYQGYVLEQFKLVQLKKELNVSIIQLEEMIGMPLAKAIPNLVL